LTSIAVVHLIQNHYLNAVLLFSCSYLSGKSISVALLSPSAAEVYTSITGRCIQTMAATNVTTRIGSVWQQRMESVREYEVIRDGNVFRTSFSDSYVCSSDYENARQLLKRLVDLYKGRSFDSVFDGKEITNEGGRCFSLYSRFPLAGTAIDVKRLRQGILADLTLVHGIGQKTQARLKARGYQTLPDLVNHQKFKRPALQVIERLSGNNSARIMDLIGCRHSKSHPSVLGAAGLHEPEEFVFLDIETLGLFLRPIILFGVGTMENRHLTVRQYILRTIEEEQAALMATCDHLSGDHRALVTFNGRSFDLPYLLNRLAYYDMGTVSGIPHFDVLHFSRRRWRGQLHSLRLAVLEKVILNVCRQVDIPGQMVPEFYDTYLQTGNCGPLIPIIEHNRQDVISLARLFFFLLGESYGCR
jgi:uncharacterized protein YprB with RNaseH-like and TPR domain